MHICIHIRIYIYIYIIIIIINIIVIMSLQAAFPRAGGPLGWLPDNAGALDGSKGRGTCVRPISLLRISLLRFLDSSFRGIPYGPENSTP